MIGSAIVSGPALLCTDCSIRLRRADRPLTRPDLPHTRTTVQELWKKKQSDVLRYLLRIRAWEYRQSPVITRCTQPTRPDKARRLGYKAKRMFWTVQSPGERGREKGERRTTWTNKIAATIAISTIDRGFCDLPRRNSPRQPQEAQQQGHCIRKAQAPRNQQPQGCPQPAEHCRGACWP